MKTSDVHGIVYRKINSEAQNLVLPDRPEYYQMVSDKNTDIKTMDYEKVTKKCRTKNSEDIIEDNQQKADNVSYAAGIRVPELD